MWCVLLLLLVVVVVVTVCQVASRRVVGRLGSCESYTNKGNRALLPCYLSMGGRDKSFREWRVAMVCGVRVVEVAAYS